MSKLNAWKNQKQPFLQMLYKIGVLKSFANFTGKNLCWNTFGPKPATLTKGDSNTGVFL